MDKQPTVELMKRYLRLYNKNIREDLVLPAVSKMKKDTVASKFNKIYKKVNEGGNVYYVPKKFREFEVFIAKSDLQNAMLKKAKKAPTKK